MSRSRRSARVRTVPGHRLAAARCWAIGHAWDSTTTAAADVLLVCARCREVVAAHFGDAGHPFGGPVSRGDSPVGEEVATRAALDLLCARLTHDEAGVTPARKILLARPGAAIDALSRLAVAVAGPEALSQLRGLSVLAELHWTLEQAGDGS